MNNAVLHCKWVLPVSPKREILENHTIVIKNNLVEKIVDTKVFVEKHHSKYKDFDIYHLDNHVVMPGLINAHTHSAMTLFRGVADDIPLMPWLQEHIWPLENKWVDDSFVRAGSSLAMLEMLKSGVTCFNDMYFFPDATAETVHEIGMRAVIGMPIIDFPSVWANDADEYFRKGVELFDRWRNHPLISTVFAPHAPYTVSDENLARVNAIAEEIDINIHMHIQETQVEVDESIKNFGERPLQRLNRLGLLNNRLLAVHMVALNDEDIDMVADYNVHVIHCPQANLKLASGISPVAKMQKKGINIALGTDGTASNNDLNMLDEAKTAALLAKGSSLDATAVSAWDAIEMLTINAAKALGIDDKVGRIKKGLQADIIAIDMSDSNTTPLYNAASHVIYSAAANQVSHVWVNGRLLMKERKMQTMNERVIKLNAIEWAKKIQAPK